MVLLRALLQSAAFAALGSGTAYRVLIWFMLKRRMVERHLGSRRKFWDVANDGAIVFTYAEAEDMGISPSAFRDALDRLLAHGFIRIAKTGKGKHRDKTLYGFSDGWRTWRPGDRLAERPKRAATAPGFRRSSTVRTAP